MVAEADGAGSGKDGLPPGKVQVVEGTGENGPKIIIKAGTGPEFDPSRAEVTGTTHLVIYPDGIRPAGSRSAR